MISELELIEVDETIRTIYYSRSNSHKAAEVAKIDDFKTFLLPHFVSYLKYYQ